MNHGENAEAGKVGPKRRTEAQLAGDRKRCLNGMCRMTPEERRQRRRKYAADRLADPFRRKQYADYFRRRRERPGVRERINEQARARYVADLERSREIGRAKYRRTMVDPVRHAAYLERKRRNRRNPDGKPTAAYRAQMVRERLIPHWERVVAEGREDAYRRRTTPANARLFHMYQHNRPLFDEMMRRSLGATMLAKGSMTMERKRTK